MRSTAIRIYHRLPSGLQRLAASAEGWRLHRWRYGKNTDALVDQFLINERLGRDALERGQQDRVSVILSEAHARVPFYQGITSMDASDLSRWPVLKKESVRSNPERFRNLDFAAWRLKRETTSGSTGTPVTFWHGRETARSWYALMEARWRRWNGVSRHDRWALVGGQLVVPTHRNRPPFWIWNAGLHQLYLSSYHLNAEHAADYFRALRDYGPAYLWGYASSLSTLAAFAEDQKLEPPRLKVVISNAEPLLPYQRALINRVFGCPVRDTYGMCEMLAGASECEAGRLHLWPEAGLVEVLDDHSDTPVPPGTAGRLVLTGLLNRAMPLIRYEVGDRGVMAPPSDPCPCGRSLPVLQSIEGRMDDMVVTPDGRQVGRLDPIFKGALPVREAQIIQEALDHIRILVVPASGFAAHHREELKQALRARLGEMRVEVEEVSVIPRSANGKLKGVISKLSKTVTNHVMSQEATPQQNGVTTESSKLPR